MVLPLYPSADFNRGNDLLVQLGSYWSQFFDDRDIVQVLMRGLGHLHAQVQQDFDETVASLSRLDIPPFHTENWYFLRLLESDRDRVLNLYGEDLIYGPDGVLYGAPTSRLEVFPLPITTFGPFAQIRFQIFNRLISPSRSLTSGLDFRLDRDRNLIIFSEDPFADELTAKRDVFDDSGALVDRELGLWVFHGEFDSDFIFRHYGFVVDAKDRSSDLYKLMVNALWDAHVEGLSKLRLGQFLSALSGHPFTRNAGEVVEVIRNEPGRRLVVTDKEVYEFPEGTVLTVAVGDTLLLGQLMSEAAEIIELSDPTNRDLSRIPALSLGESSLSGPFIGELVFRNKVVPFDFTVDENDCAEVRFEISGFPADIETFWRQAQAEGKASGATLAELLDQRPNPSGQPAAANIPATVNPLEFIIDNLLENNLFVILMKPGQFTADAPGLEHFRSLRAVVPPHTAFVSIIELQAETDIIELEDTTEGAISFLGNSVPADEISVADIEDAVVSVFPVSTFCEP